MLSRITAPTEHFVADSLVLRQFCRLGLDPVPYHTTLLRWANLLQPETMHRLLDRVTQLAWPRELEPASLPIDDRADGWSASDSNRPHRTLDWQRQ